MNEHKRGRINKGEPVSKVISVDKTPIGITFDKYRYERYIEKLIRFDFICPLSSSDRTAGLNFYGMIAYVDGDIFAAVSNYLKIDGLKYVDIKPKSNINGNGWQITTFKPAIPINIRWSRIESQIQVRPGLSEMLTIPQLAALMVQFIVDEISYKTEDFVVFDERTDTYTINLPHSFRKNIMKKYDIFYPDKSLFQSSTKYIVKGLKHSKELDPDSNWKIVIKSKK